MAADRSRAASTHEMPQAPTMRRTCLDGAAAFTPDFKWRVGLIPEPREALWLSNPLLALCGDPGPMVPQTRPSRCDSVGIPPLPSPAQPLGSGCRNDK